jgi:Ser/Thr protein kinase RdoA (MazF antagonist)
MDNIERVTDHLARVLAAEGVRDLERRCLTLVRSGDGRPYWIDPLDRWWRAYRYVDNSRSCEGLGSPQEAFRIAAAFGAFARRLQDLPGRLHETISGFHDTLRHLDTLRRAVLDDAYGRAAHAREEIDFILRREASAQLLSPTGPASGFPERVVHNDTKVDNVLCDRDTGEVLCVVDLDTVMPGCLLHDFGDLVRSAAARGAEDIADHSRVAIDLSLYEALARGYLDGTRALFTPAELELLPLAPRVITLELAARFLTDHLCGDRYFKIRFPGQNLRRCQVQERLLWSMELQAREMREIAARSATGGACFKA